MLGGKEINSGPDARGPLDEIMETTIDPGKRAMREKFGWNTWTWGRNLPALFHPQGARDGDTPQQPSRGAPAEASTGAGACFHRAALICTIIMRSTSTSRSSLGCPTDKRKGRLETRVLCPRHKQARRSRPLPVDHPHKLPTPPLLSATFSNDLCCPISDLRTSLWHPLSSKPMETR